MQLIIDIQGFNDNNDNFVPKEIAIVSLDEEKSVGHWVIAPDYPFYHLEYNARARNIWLTNNHHNLYWRDGSVKIDYVVQELRKITKNVDFIYVRGSCKSKYLQEILEKNIIDLETDIYNPSFEKMPVIEEKCYLHCSRKNNKRKYSCALKNALIIRQWILEGSRKIDLYDLDSDELSEN